MFVIEKDAAQYISEHLGSVVIGLKLEPSTGGCQCSGKIVTGSYIPYLSMGKPTADERDKYQLQLVERVEVYFPAELTAKQGAEIRIKLRGLFWWHWLELEGAKAIAVYN